MANNLAIYTGTPDIQWSNLPVTASNTAKDGTGTVTTVFTADATNGGFVQKIRFRPTGTNVATVIRIFINNGSTNATAANNTLWDEYSLPATTITETAQQPVFELPLNFALPAGYKLNVTLGTAVAAGYMVPVIGGKY